MKPGVWRTAILLALGAVLLAGCGTDTRVTRERADARPRLDGVIAYGEQVAACEEAIPTDVRIGGSDPRRRFVSTNHFGLLQSRDGFQHAQQAEAALGAGSGRPLIANASATVLRTRSVTVAIPAGARDRAGLVFGSLQGYQHPFAQVTFERCPGSGGTSWSGGLVLLGREPVTLLVTEEDGEEIRRLRVGQRVPSSVPVATGTQIARCRHAMLGDTRIGAANLRRHYNAAGRFALLEHPDALKFAQPAAGQLAPRFRSVLLTKIPATVLGTAPVTLTVPVAARDRAGLVYGSLSGYRAPFAEVTFMPCRDRAGTSWPGGLALRTRRPVTLSVSTAGGERTWWLRVGG